MKKLNKILFAATALGVSCAGLTSCDTDKQVEYQPSPIGKEQPYFFEVQAPIESTIGNSDYSTVFYIRRSSLDQPSTVQLEWSGDLQLFDELPSSIEFDEEELEGIGVVYFDPSLFEPGVTYSVKATIPGTETTANTQNYLDFTYIYEPFTEWEVFGYDPTLGRYGIGVYTFTAYFGGQDVALVETRTSELDSNVIQYRFSWPVVEDYGEITVDPINPNQWEQFMFIQSNDNGKTLFIPAQYFTDNSNYGAVYVTDQISYFEGTPNESTYKMKCKFDDVSGTFSLGVVYFVDGGYFTPNLETLVLDGYADTNVYTVKMSNVGQTEIDQVNYDIFNLSWSETVDIVAYTAVETSSVTDEYGDPVQDLIEDVIQDMLNDKISYQIAEEPGLYSITFAESGKYTIIGVGFKEESNGYVWKTYSTLNIEFDNGDPNAGWTSLGYLEYTDGYMCAAFGIDPATYYVEVQESDDYKDYYRLVDPYGAAFPYNDPGDWNEKVHSYLYFDLQIDDMVYVDYSPQTVDWGYGPLTCASVAWAYLVDGSYTPDQILDLGVFGTFADGKVTFPYSDLIMWLGNDGPYIANVVAIAEEEIAPFCVDFNTLTDDPLAEAASASTRMHMNLTKGSLNLKPVAGIPNKKGARIVKFKSAPYHTGKRTPFVTSINPR